MPELYITHYYLRGTDPWQNIMALPEKEAFRKAKELAAKYEYRTSVGRFADFERYYPLRKNTDKTVREAFIRLGGHPRLAHPYHFVLLECGYLREWYDNEESLRIPLDDIPDDQISFTLGDSCAKYAVKDTLEVLTKELLREKLRAFDNSLEKLLESIPPFRYVEAQIWCRPET